MAAVYASVEDLRSYVAATVNARELGDDAAVNALLERSERDVDRAAGGPLHPDRRRRFAPVELTAAQREALARATCAAAEFRVRQGEQRLVGHDSGIEQAGSVSFARTGTLPRRAVKVLEELAGFGLVGRAGTPVTPDAGA